MNINFYTFMIRGKQYDEPHAGQKEVLDSDARFKVVCCGRRWGKALDIETPILTSEGFKKLEDVEVGDYVYSEKGLPVKVLYKSEVYQNRECYEVEFSDGTSIVADASHDWVVEDKKYRKNSARAKYKKYKMLKIPTKDMIPGLRIKRADGKDETNYSIPVCQPIKHKDKDLLIDPYLLGQWLGDGNSSSFAITTIDEETIEYLYQYAKDNGYEIRKEKSPNSSSYTYHIHGDRTQESRDNSLTARLRELGVLNNKHIPEVYQLAAPEQRLQLLKGLMDSDGYIENGYCEYTSTNQHLAEDVMELLWSFGIKATLGEYDCNLYGRYIGKKYRIHFSTDLDVFRLTRKKAEQKTKRKPDVFRRFIVNIKPVKSRPVQCLGVDNPTHLFLAGKQLVSTHNTSMSVNTLLEHAIANDHHTYWYIGPTFRQAKTIAWRYLKSRISMFPKEHQKLMKVNETNLSVEFWNGSIVEFKGVERPDNLLGVGLDGVVLDEYSTDTYGTAPVWKEIIRPALSDKQGWAIFISTPRGYNHFYELFSHAQASKDGTWEAWQMPSKTNPVITEKELKAARNELGPDLYSQEYEAQFKKRSGLVYPEFSRDVHVIDKVDEKKIHSGWSLELGIDFGGSHPTAAVFVLFSKEDDTAYVVDEYYEANLSTDKHAGAMKAIEDHWLNILRHPAPRVRWGDNQAKQSIIDYAQVGYHITPVIKGRDSVMSGINEVKKRLSVDLVTHKPRIYITKNCTNLIREFENYVWLSGDDGTMETDEMMRLANKRTDKPRKTFDDAMDALRYVLSHHVRVGAHGVVRPTRRNRNPLTGL